MSTPKTLFKAVFSVVVVSVCAYGLIVVSSLWFFAKPSIKLGQVITIAAPDANANANLTGNTQSLTIELQHGWAYPENWGAWSIANQATLSLPKPPGNAKLLTLEVRALVSAKHPEQLVNVIINGQQRRSATLTQEDGNQLIIPLEASNSNHERLMITLQLPNAIAPSTLGIGQDDRQLAIGLKSARYQ